MTHPAASQVAIDLAERAYELDGSDDVWLGRVLRCAQPALDEGNGLLAATIDPSADGGAHVAWQSLGGTADLLDLWLEASKRLSPETVQALFNPGQVSTASTFSSRFPNVREAGACLIQRGIIDMLRVDAADPNGRGVSILAARAQCGGVPTEVGARWRKIAVHLTAGYRLRCALREPGTEGLPLGGEAVIDARTRRLSDATGDAQSRGALERLREAAKRVDRARGKLRKSDPEAALELWRGLVTGRWSLVDWYDTDGRRFVIARPNAADITDPRGLSERERQIATYAALGDSNKMVSYRLGLSQSTVSGHLRAAMRKLRVRTRAGLVRKLRSGAPPPRTAGS